MEDQEQITEVRQEYNIPSCHMPELTERFNKLAKKARKLGCPVPSFNVIETYVITYRRHPYTDVEFVVPLDVEYTKVRIEGEVLKYAGWTFLGTIEHTVVGNVIRAVPGVELDEHYRTELTTCDHCHTTRKRNNTYVVRHEDGTEKRVGSTCVGDFLGHDSPEKVAAQLEAFFKFFRGLAEDEGEFRQRMDFTVPIKEFLAITSCCIRAFGWTSRSAAQDNPGLVPTTEDVSNYAFGTSTSAKETRREHPLTDEDFEVAEKALNWVLELSPEQLRQDYLYNINIVARMERVDGSHFGLAASIIPAYKREVERDLLQRARREAGEASQWVGEVGQRLDITAVCVSIMPHEGSMGTIYITKFLKDGRDQLTWFASSAPGFREGATVTMKATVKAHDEWHGIHQTTITRCKVAA